MVASTDPVLLSFPFPFHHPGGTGFSTLGEGKKARIHRTTIHSAREAAEVRLLQASHVQVDSNYSMGSLVFRFHPAVIGAPIEPSGLCGRYSTMIWA